MKRIISASLVATLAILFTVANAEARPRKGRHFGGPGMGPGMGKELAELNLTDEQKTEIQKLESAMREEVKPLEQKAHELREKMGELWRAENPDEGAIIALHKQINKLHGQMGEIFIEYRFDITAVLTPAQRAELRENVGKRFQKFRKGKDGKGWKRGKGPGPGRGFGGEGECQCMTPNFPDAAE